MQGISPIEMCPTLTEDFGEGAGGRPIATVLGRHHQTIPMPGSAHVHESRADKRIGESGRISPSRKRCGGEEEKKDD
jgi:hypothetical protein